MLPFKLVEDLSVQSQEDLEKIIAEMRKAQANDDDASAATTEIDTTNPPTLSR